MATSEIEKLERRYAENPNGLTFAPLAEVYRKNGDVASALELLGSGIERHPEYIPARIVLGRCHLDLGALSEAEQAFRQVIALDVENVIALKALADISERSARYDDAERWLTTLLAVDRNNEAAREQLARLDSLREQTAFTHRNEVEPDAPGSAAADTASATSSEADIAADTAAGVAAWVAAEPVDANADVSAEAVAPVEMHDAAFEDAAHGDAVRDDAPRGAVASEDVTPGASDEWDDATWRADAVPGDFPDPAAVTLEAETVPAGEPRLAEDFDSLAPDVAPPDELPPAEGLEVLGAEALPEDETVAPIDGFMTRDSATLRDELEPLHDDFRIETADDLVLRPSLATEFQMPDASLDLVAARPDDDPFRSPAPGGVSAAEDSGDRGEGADLPPQSVAEEPESTVEEPAAEEQKSPVQEPEPVVEELVAAFEDPVAAFEDPVASDAEHATAARSVPEPIEPEPDTETHAAEPGLIVTETMAEVLLQQGHREDALRIYRELERRSGGDARLQAKLTELEADAPPAANAPRTYLARHSDGESVAVFFRTLLAARIPAAPARGPGSALASGATAGSGAPTRPASDTLSLSAVFGDEGSAAPPAMSADGKPAGVSFDEFFGAARPSGAHEPRVPTAQTDDLDQFHTWLQNLKR